MAEAQPDEDKSALKHKIDSAMTTHEGNRFLAAGELDMTQTQLSMAINKNKFLRSKWSKSTFIPVNTEGSLSSQTYRPSSEGTPVDPEYSQALKAAGLSESDIASSVSYAAATSNHLDKMLNTVAGGFVETAMRLKKTAQKASKRLDKNKYEYEDSIAEKTVDAMMIMKAAEMETKIAGTLNTMITDKAKISHLKELAENERRSPRLKPGFKPVVAIQADNVTLASND